MQEVAVTDYHTAGEPFRIVAESSLYFPGATVAERREHALTDQDANRLRRFLCHEPRGHADMYGGFLVPPDDAGADLGILFWHKDGFSTACGHGTMALGAWAVETGKVATVPTGETSIVVDVPSGRVTAKVCTRDGVVESVAFRNVPAYVLGRRVSVATSWGDVLTDVVYSGAIYATVPAAAFGLQVRAGDYAELIKAGRQVKHELDKTKWAKHPVHPRLSGVYGTILYDDLGDQPTGPHQRNVTIFADGQADRSPCGSGTSARAAVLAVDGRLGPGKTLLHESIVGTRFTARVAQEVMADSRPAYVTEVRGMAYCTGDHRFRLDPRDALGTGFVLR